MRNPTLTETDFTGSGALSAIDCGGALPSVMPPGASITCTASYQVQQGDVDRGTLSNSAEARATAADGTSLVETAEVTLPAPAEPGIVLSKTVEPASFSAGTTLRYTFVLTNRGLTTLNRIDLQETAFTGTGSLSALDCDLDLAQADLAPGATATCTASYPVTQADVEAGRVTNTAEAVGTDEQDQVTRARDSAVSYSAAAPQISLTKAVDLPEYGAGQDLTYRYLITNSGALSLTNLDLVETSFTGSGTTPAPACTPALSTGLAPGASITCTATYTTTQADLDAGGISNTATVTATDPQKNGVSASDTAVSSASTATASISLDKSVDQSEYRAGEALNYRYLITNTGALSLTNLKLVEDSFTGSGTTPTPACTPTLSTGLAPGASITCTATYTTTQVDLDAGSISNSATVSGTDYHQQSVQASDTARIGASTATASILLDKTVSPTQFTLGEELTYTFEITNTGQVSLRNLGLTEDDFTGTGELSAIDCGDQLGAGLRPAQVITCTASYTPTQADLDAGGVDNSATITAADPTGGIVSSSDLASASATGGPAISLVKQVEEDDFQAGDRLHYSFLVTNTGTVTLADLELTEQQFSGSGSMTELACDGGIPDRLEPGAGFRCTAEYSATEDDRHQGVITNSATASGSHAGSVVQDTDQASISAGEPTDDGTAGNDETSTNTGIPGTEPNWPLLAVGACLALIALAVGVNQLHRRSSNS